MTQYEKISLINGRIHTPSGIAASITFENGRIVSIDDQTAASDGKIIDINGRTVLPGFCDTGLNFLFWAENQDRLNLSDVHSSKEIYDALKAYSEANPNPLRGWYIAYNFPDNFVLSRDELDAVIPSMPCALINSKDSHAVLNSVAMNEFNMPQDDVELDEFSQHLPSLSDNDIIYLIKNYVHKATVAGITEIWGDFYGNAENIWSIFSESVYDTLPFRIRCNFGFDSAADLNEFLSTGLRTGDGLPFCKVGGILIRDGLEQYEQKNMIYSAHLSGCQVITENNKSCLNALERVSKKVSKNTRHIVKNFTSGLIERMKILNLNGMAVSGQEYNFMSEAFRNGLVVCAGSGELLKSPVKNISELVYNGLSVAEALSVYTWSSSWNGGFEARRGELAVGNDADIVVLEQDPFLLRPEEIAGIDVTMTFCAGCSVYDSGML